MTDTAAEPLPRTGPRRSPVPAPEPVAPRLDIAAEAIQVDVPPTVRAMLAPLIAALRWCAVVLGTALAAPKAADGDIGLVLTMSVCLDLTAWRTMRPLRIGSNERPQLVMSITDAVLLGAAVGVNDGFESPFMFCLVVSAAVAAFGWGVSSGLSALIAGISAIGLTATLSGSELGLSSQHGWLVLLLSVVMIPTIGVIRNRLVESEQQRVQLAGRIDTLAETNELLHVLNRVARTLPSSLDLQQAITTTRGQLLETFDASVIGILTMSDANDSWAPLLAEGLAIPPVVARDGIASQLRSALDSDRPVLISDVTGRGLSPTSGSGIYTALRTRGKVVGLLAIEHPRSGRYSERDAHLLAGLGEALALTLDNARWFRRLRILGAEEERARIARDLHDRLGQWLTFISFELERIKSNHPGTSEAAELDALHQDVQRAIDELRETLRQMRTAVTDNTPLAAVANDLMTRYAQRTGIQVAFNSHAGVDRLPVAVENELLRILQEALNNVDKHANATEVVVDWTVDAEAGRFRIADNGDGFDESTGVRETAFGLVGMRERAEVIDAQLIVTSAPGAGTTIDVIVPREEAA